MKLNIFFALMAGTLGVVNSRINQRKLPGPPNSDYTIANIIRHCGDGPVKFVLAESCGCDDFVVPVMVNGELEFIIDESAVGACDRPCYGQGGLSCIGRIAVNCREATAAHNYHFAGCGPLAQCVVGQCGHQDFWANVPAWAKHHDP